MKHWCVDMQYVTWSLPWHCFCFNTMTFWKMAKFQENCNPVKPLWKTTTDCHTCIILQWVNSCIQSSVAKFRKLLGRYAKQRKFIHPPRIEATSTSQCPVISLSSHWPKDNSISFKDRYLPIYPKKCFPSFLFIHRMFTRPFWSRIKMISDSLILRNIFTITILITSIQYHIIFNTYLI